MVDESDRTFEDVSAEPLEVRLVADVTTCRACGWFWDDPPYGPYPAFDFGSDFPDEVRQRPEMDPPPEGEAALWPKGPIKCHYPDPQILHGCRKAPIMTIGINPNLTAFWPGTMGARWAYPRFSRLARYAYHYRHRTLYQESLDLDFIRRNVDPETALRAEGTGRIVKVDFASDRRHMAVTVVYDDPRRRQKTYRIDWDSARNFVLLHDRSRKSAPPQFHNGEIIGGFVCPDSAQPRQVSSETVGYYQRMVPILSILEAHFRANGDRATLALGEDICQLDMVACASPGWGGKYKIDKREVSDNCVADKAWAIKQLVQSRPAVIVFAGRSAFELFHAYLPKSIRPGIRPAGRETYDLLAKTTRWPYYMDIDEKVGGRRFRLRARVAIAPHFSHDDNFVPHTRFSPRAWEEFETKEPDAVTTLEDLGALREKSRDDYTPVDLRGLGDFQVRFPSAMAYLLRNFYEPNQMIGGMMVQEAILGNLTFDAERRRLTRAEGPCRFCDNGAWTFPEGCAYGKPDEDPYPADFLDKVVDKLLAGAGR